MSATLALMAATSDSKVSALVADLRNIVGKKHTLTDDGATRRYRTGFRFGAGKALAVVRPGTIVEQWKVLQACMAANVIVITQASNTGLTGGSTPDGDDYDRDIVIVRRSRVATPLMIVAAPGFGPPPINCGKARVSDAGSQVA